MAFDAAGSLIPQENPNPPKPLRVGASLPLLFGVQAWKRGKWTELWRDFLRAEDVIAGLPARAQWLAFGEMLWRSVKYRKPLTSASTFDIEFDGDGN